MKTKLMIALLIGSVFASFNSYADGSKVQLGGYCAVGYVGANKAVYGDPKFASEYEGKTYYLSSEGAKKMFDAEPAKFAEAYQYDTYCATGVALGKKLATDPSIFSTIDGKIYLFSSQGAKDAFDKDQKGMLAKAEKNWKKLSKE